MATEKKVVKNNSAQIKVIQTGSPIGKKYDQRQTLIGLGLNKMHKSRILKDTPSARGMINRVKHLITVENIN